MVNIPAHSQIQETDEKSSISRFFHPQVSPQTALKLRKLAVLAGFGILNTTVYLLWCLITKVTNIDIKFLRATSMEFSFFGKKIEFPSIADRYLLGTVVILSIYGFFYTFIVTNLFGQLRRGNNLPQALKATFKDIKTKKKKGLRIFLKMVSLLVILISLDALTWSLKLHFNVEDTKSKLAFLALFSIFFIAEIANQVINFIIDQNNYDEEKRVKDGNLVVPEDISDKEPFSLGKISRKIKGLYTTSKKNLKREYPLLLIAGLFIALSSAGAVVLCFFGLDKLRNLNLNFKLAIPVGNIKLVIINNENGFFFKIAGMAVYAFISLFLFVKLKNWAKEKNDQRVENNTSFFKEVFAKKSAAEEKEPQEKKGWVARIILPPLYFMGALVAAVVLGIAENVFGQLNNSMMNAKVDAKIVATYAGLIFLTIICCAVTYFVKCGYLFGGDEFENKEKEQTRKMGNTRGGIEQDLLPSSRPSNIFDNTTSRRSNISY